MSGYRITPGRNGWTENAGHIARGIAQAERERNYEANSKARRAERERAELEYYEENNCYPRPTGYFGTENDAHFYER